MHEISKMLSERDIVYGWPNEITPMSLAYSLIFCIVMWYWILLLLFVAVPLEFRNQIQSAEFHCWLCWFSTRDSSFHFCCCCCLCAVFLCLCLFLCICICLVGFFLFIRCDKPKPLVGKIILEHIWIRKGIDGKQDKQNVAAMLP